MIKEQFEAIFINSFALDPRELGMTIDGNQATLNEHTITLVEVRGRLSHWDVNGEHMVDYELYNRDDARRMNNKMNLVSKLGLELEVASG